MVKGKKGTNIFLLVIMGMILLSVYFANNKREADEYNRANLIADIEKGRVEETIIQPNKDNATGAMSIKLKSGEKHILYLTDVVEMQHKLQEYDIEATILDVESENVIVYYIVPLIFVAAIIGFVFFLLTSQGGGGAGSKMMNFGKSRAKLASQDIKITLKDVAGLQEEKEDLEEIIDFLKLPAKYTKIGARIPKGVLLEGPPGTGKTLLAKAVAGEAGVPFFSISGSEFVEMFVGVGASRVRDLFDEAKKNLPCIVFIDEIDAVARRRGTGMGGGHDEREQTLNQLLVEMDGFGINQGIIVMAATNRIDILDPAILRPGRFDRRIRVGRPDVVGREEILKVHSNEKLLGDDVDLVQVARTTSGFTGADLENLMNEAAILAAKSGRTYIQQDDIRQSFIKVGMGTEKKSKIISDKEKKITAYHESGHGILFHVLPDVGPVYTISIIPVGSCAGYTMPLPDKDDMFMTKSRMLQEVMVLFGGRIAEELIFDDVTTGASNDIKRATEMVRSLVTKYGMSDNIGMINYADEDEVFIGRDMAHPKNHSEFMTGEIDKEVRAIIEDCYSKAKKIIEENIDVLHRSAELLISKEKITKEEFEELFPEEMVKSSDVEMGML